APNFLAYPRL
nr:small cardioactive peptide-related peptide [Mytilus edulis]